MALEPQTAEVPFTFGIDQTQNEEGDPQGFGELENHVWVDADSLARRPGFKRVATWTPDRDPSLVVAGNSLLAGFRNFSADWGRSSTDVDFSSLTHRGLRTDWVGRRIRQVDSSVYTTASLTLMLQVESCYIEEYATSYATPGAVPSGVFWRLIDLETNVIMQSGRIQVGGLSILAPRVVIKGTTFYLAYLTRNDSTHVHNLEYITFNASTPTAAPSASTTVATGVLNADGQQAIDLHYNGGKVWLAWISSSAQVSIKAIDTLGATVASHSSATTGQSLSVTSGNGQVIVMNINHSVASSQIDGTVWTDAASPVFVRQTEGALPAVITTTGTFVDVACMYVDSSHVRVAATCVTATTTELQAVNFIPSTAGTGSLTVLTSMQMVSRPFVLPDGSTPAIIACGSQNDYRVYPIISFASTTSFSVLGVLGFDEATAIGVPSGAGFVAINSDFDNTKYWTALQVTLAANDAQSSIPTNRVRVSELTFGDLGHGDLVLTPKKAEQLNGTGFIPGSLTQTYDGRGLLPAAFVTAPTTPSAASGAATGLTGTFSYVLVKEYTNALGQTQLSPPSAETSVTVTNHKIDITVFDGEDGFGDGNQLGLLRRLRLYRTTDAGANFFLLLMWQRNTGSGNYVITDNTSDATLQTGEALYTTGGVLESELCPPTRSLCAHRNRLFGVRGDDARTICFTQEIVDGQLPRWHSSLTFRIDNDGADPTAVCSMDDKLLVFQPDRISAVTGQGPDGTGAGNFQLPEEVARAAGVDHDNRNSVVNVPSLGTFFRYATGIKLLKRDLSVVNIGRAVSASLADRPIIMARYLRSREEVWFLQGHPVGSSTVNFPILVFNLTFQRWTTFTGAFTGYLIDVAETADGRVYLLDGGTANGVQPAKLYLLDTTSYADRHDGFTPVYPDRVLRMPWFRGSGRDGELRLWRVGLSGQCIDGTGETIRIDAFTQQPMREISHDPNDADNSFTWTSAQLTNIPDNAGFRRNARIVTQRCAAFRVDVTLSHTGSPDSEGLRLTALEYEYGAEPSKGKTAAGQKPTIV